MNKRLFFGTAFFVSGINRKAQLAAQPIPGKLTEDEPKPGLNLSDSKLPPMKKLLTVIALFALFGSCKREKADSTIPTISNIQPADNSVFTSGQNINIRGTLADNDLHAGSIKITNDADDAVLNAAYLSIHGISTYNMNENMSVTVSVATNATIIIRVEDYTGNTGEKKIPIRINP